jgi:hypothetical protein
MTEDEYRIYMASRAVKLGIQEIINEQAELNAIAAEEQARRNVETMGLAWKWIKRTFFLWLKLMLTLVIGFWVIFTFLAYVSDNGIISLIITTIVCIILVGRSIVTFWR